MRHFESLESRQLLAGNVTTGFDGLGHWTITGDNKANQIRVGVHATNGITVFGEDGTTVNGAAEVSFGPAVVNTGLVIKMGNGNDRVKLDGGIFQAVPTTIETGNGDDEVSLTEWAFFDDITVDTGNGADTVAIGDTFLGGDVVVNLGNGADAVTFFGSVTGGGSVHVNGGNGHDSASGLGSLAGTLTTAFDSVEILLL